MPKIAHWLTYIEVIPQNPLTDVQLEYLMFQATVMEVDNFGTNISSQSFV